MRPNRVSERPPAIRKETLVAFPARAFEHSTSHRGMAAFFCGILLFARP